MTRVELVDIDDDDDDVYEKLHEQMEKNGFSRKITSDKGTTYHLPRAEYFYETDDEGVSARWVCDRAKAAADKAAKESRVITAKAESFAWTNLEKA